MSTPAGVIAQPEVRDLGAGTSRALAPDELLAHCADAERAAWAAECRKLDLALAWGHAHPAPADEAARGRVETVGGDGTPEVEELTTEPLGVAFGITTHAALQLLSDALDLAHRLPQTWARVRALEVPAWRARRIAQTTSTLSLEQALVVDAAVAGRAATIGVVGLERIIAEVVAEDDPADQEEAEVLDRRHWSVRLFHDEPTRWRGTSILEITGDTADLTDLYALLTDHAPQTPEPIDVRRAAAVRTVCDLARGGAHHTGAGAAPRPGRARLYLHADLADLDDATVGVGSVERLGPATTTLIKEWVGHRSVTVVPVIRADRTDAVDQHDPPLWMRELVTLRDAHCVFPWCRTHSRSCDLDHIEAYLDPDDGGPPGQTHPDNLAPLCRRHHRAKTRRTWHYRRDPDGSYRWTGPQGQHLVVDEEGTHALTAADR